MPKVADLVPDDGEDQDEEEDRQGGARPVSPNRKDWLYISLATTEVSNWPPVMVRTMSKTFSVPR